MRILYLSQYFPPEVGATQTRAYEMARGLVRAGHQVTMLTELPNHPSGIVQPGYQGRWLVRRELDGIDVIHTWVRASPQKTLRTRLRFYVSYMVSAVIAGLLGARALRCHLRHVAAAFRRRRCAVAELSAPHAAGVPGARPVRRNRPWPWASCAIVASSPGRRRWPAPATGPAGSSP